MSQNRRRFGKVQRECSLTYNDFSIRGHVNNEIFEDELKRITVTFSDSTTQQFFPRMSDFSSFDSKISGNLSRLHIERPTTIQSTMMPYLFECSSDLAISSRTGTGKTFGYLLPILDLIHRYREEHEHVQTFKIDNRPFAIIMLPNSFMVDEVATIVNRLAAGTGIKVVCALKKDDQKKEYKELKSEGCDIYISIIGKIDNVFRPENKHSNPSLLTSRLNFVVLDNLPAHQYRDAKEFMDEAVRLNSPECRLVVVASDCLDPERLLQLTRPECVKLEIDNHYMFHDVKQKFVDVKSNNKMEDLKAICKGYIKGDKKVLIFVNDKATGESICTDLLIWAKNKISVDFLVSVALDKTTSVTPDIIGQYEKLEDFRSGVTNVLIVFGSATLKSLNIPNIELVVNYDFPQTGEDYAAQIGCTGRIYNSGQAVTFFDSKIDRGRLIHDIIEICANSGQEEATTVLKSYI